MNTPDYAIAFNLLDLGQMVTQVCDSGDKAAKSAADRLRAKSHELRTLAYAAANCAYERVTGKPQRYTAPHHIFVNGTYSRTIPHNPRKVIFGAAMAFEDHTGKRFHYVECQKRDGGISFYVQPFDTFEEFAEAEASMTA